MESLRKKNCKFIGACESSIKGILNKEVRGREEKYKSIEDDVMEGQVDEKIHLDQIPVLYVRGTNYECGYTIVRVSTDFHFLGRICADKKFEDSPNSFMEDALK